MPRSRAVARLAPALLLLAVFGLDARAQSPTEARASSFDSLAVLRGAVEQVNAFERTRAANAPRAPSDRYCDLRIGRYCVRYGIDGREPPPEPGRTVQARADLIDALADAARQLPADQWIAGQRVRYLLEQGRLGAAVAAAGDCRASGWWCSALEGLALHAQGESARADSLFAQVLRAMPKELRCAWTDLSPLLGAEAGHYVDMPCEAREGANLPIWWLGRPLYSRPGNDLRTEHYARHVMALILAATDAGRMVEPPADLTEYTVRYGWPVYWVQPTGRPGDEPPGLLRGSRSPSWSFLAASGIPPSWDLTRERPVAVYAPTWASRFVTIPDAQIARFRRGDSVVTIAGFDVSADTALRGQTPRVRLAVGTDAASPVVVGAAVAATHGGVSVRSADPPAVVSLEAVHEASGWVGRLRTATADPTAWVTSRMSDLLLVGGDATAPGPGESLTTIALPGVALPAGRPVGVYWEWYDHPARGTTVTIEARVARLGKSGRPSPLGRSECVPAERAAIGIQWRETIGDRPPLGRAVALDLRRLEAGRYLAAISMQAGQDSVRCSSRELVLLGP